MIKFRVCLLFALFVCVSLVASTTLVYGQDGCENNVHFLRAKEIQATSAAGNDPRIDREYRWALTSSGGKCTEALRELGFHLARQLRFSEAATVLKDYINRTANGEHSIEMAEVAELQKGATTKTLVDKGETVSLDNLLDLIRLIHGYAEASDAVPYAERAVELYPKSTKAIVALVRELPDTQTVRKKELLDKAVELEPDNVEVRNTRGWLYMWWLRSYTDAETEFRVALKLSGNQNSGAWYGLGKVLEYQGKKQEAIVAFRKFLQICRNSPQCPEADAERLIEKLENDLPMD